MRNRKRLLLGLVLAAALSGGCAPRRVGDGHENHLSYSSSRYEYRKPRTRTKAARTARTALGIALGAAAISGEVLGGARWGS